MGIKLIVGLGNPGRQYHETRHNAGFWFVDGLVAKYGGTWVAEVKFQGLLASVICGGEKVLLFKPQTFMNLSGRAVGSLLRYYKLGNEDILIAHDELDLPVGVVKLKKSGGHAGHNGLRDIIASLGGSDFYRLRIGINRPSPGYGVADYVLSSPSASEREGILTALAKVYDGFELLVEGQYEILMNRMN